MGKTIYTKEHAHLVAQLKKARVHAGLRQNVVADRLGHTQSYISKLEAGQRRIDIVQLKRLAKLYKKELDYFLQ